MANADVPINVGVNLGTVMCLQCVTENSASEEENKPEVRRALTLAPMWVTKNIGPQLIVTAVAVPTCAEHLNVKEKSPQELAMEGGILLGGAPG